jgi:D-beta-D-heptose 7-phosphate kinase/D-beta-D-heptose 1-phosphate adenosyltransferase
MSQTLPALSSDRLHALLDAMARTRIAVVGDVMLDRYLLGDVERISPEAPVPVVTVASEESVPGGAANVAANLAALGASPLLVGAIGDDVAGTTLRGLLTRAGIGGDGLTVVPGRPTTTKTRIVARGQQVVRLDHEVTSPLSTAGNEQLAEAAADALETADALALEDYDKGVLDPIFARALITEAVNKGIPIVVDPKQRHFFGYPGATVFKPNRRELEQAFGAPFEEAPHALEAARTRLRAEHLLLTLGAEGMLLVSEGQGIRRTPSIAREVFDVSGAGDTVTAWLVAALAAGADIAEAAWLANLAAGVVVGKRGTATVSVAEVRSMIEER